MVCLPGVVGSGSVTTNVADNCCLSDEFCGFAVARVIEHFLFLCYPNVLELLNALRVSFATRLIAEFPAI